VPDGNKSPPLPGWELTNDGARAAGVHQRTLIADLNKIGADVLYYGGRRHNKVADRDRAIRARIQRRSPPRRPPPFPRKSGHRIANTARPAAWVRIARPSGWATRSSGR
jgi:hypothetical protein